MARPVSNFRYGVSTASAETLALTVSTPAIEIGATKGPAFSAAGAMSVVASGAGIGSIPSSIFLKSSNRA